MIERIFKGYLINYDSSSGREIRSKLLTSDVVYRSMGDPNAFVEIPQTIQSSFTNSLAGRLIRGDIPRRINNADNPTRIMGKV